MENLKAINEDFDNDAEFDTKSIYVAELDGAPGTKQPVGDFTVTFTYVSKDVISCDFSSGNTLEIRRQNKRVCLQDREFQIVVQQLRRITIFQ